MDQGWASMDQATLIHGSRLGPPFSAVLHPYVMPNALHTTTTTTVAIAYCPCLLPLPIAIAYRYRLLPIAHEDPWIKVGFANLDPWIKVLDPWIKVLDPWIKDGKANLDPWIKVLDPWIMGLDPWIATHHPFERSRSPGGAPKGPLGRGRPQ